MIEVYNYDFYYIFCNDETLLCNKLHVYFLLATQDFMKHSTISFSYFLQAFIISITNLSCLISMLINYLRGVTSMISTH